MLIETDLPRGPGVGCGDDLAVAECKFEAFRGGCFALRACGADWLVVESDGPFVGCISERACGFLAANCFEVVGDDLFGGRKFFVALCERRVRREGEKQQQAKETPGGIKHI